MFKTYYPKLFNLQSTTLTKALKAFLAGSGMPLNVIWLRKEYYPRLPGK